IGFVFGPRVLVVCQLRLLGKIFDTTRGAVALFEQFPGVAERVVRWYGSGVKIPVLVNRPQLVGRNKFLQAFERGNDFVVAFFCRGTAGRAIFLAEPIAWRMPDIRPSHVNTTP